MYHNRFVGCLFSKLVILTMGMVLLSAGNALSQTDARSVTVAVIIEPDTLDLSSTKHEPTAMVINRNFTELLIDLSTDGKRIPGLATSWTLSPDGKQLDFTLRKGVRFHSGDPLTVQDVEFSYTRYKERTSATGVRWVERFEALDDYHFRFYFKKPDVNFLPNLAFIPIVSKSYYDRVGEDEFVRKPSGTGPYKFTEWKMGEYISIKANENYWGEAPSVKDVQFKIVREDTTRVAMLQSGEVDIIMDTPFALVGNLEASGFKTVKQPSMPTCQVIFQNLNKNVPWYDRRVRLAIAHAIDGDAIVKNLFHGVPARYAAIAPWELGYDPDLKPYSYDPERSKQLLREAGYPNGLEIPLYYPTGRVTGIKETAEAVVLFLNAVGIKCKVEGMEIAKYMNRVRNEWHGNPEGVDVSVGTPPSAHYPDPTWALQVAYYSKSPTGLYNNPEFDKVILQALTELDDAKRAILIRKAIQIIHEDVASIPIWSNMSVYSMKPNVEFTPTMGTQYAIMRAKDIKLMD